MKRNSYYLFLIFTLINLFIFSPPSKPIFADNDEVPKLQQKVLELETRIKQLEALLDEKKQVYISEKDAESGWQNTKNWRRLEKGMSQESVKSVLGEPIKVIKGVKTLWYYPNIYCGYCSFDKDGKLAGWNEP